MTTPNIPGQDHVVRYVPWGKLRKDKDDKVVGVLGTAFQMRDVETTLSSTWLEFFSGARDAQIAEAVRTVRSSSLVVKPKSGFAIGKVDCIKGSCLLKGHAVRILHEPTHDNEAHVAVRRLPRDDSDLFELLAEDAWSELVLNKDIP